jgi:hypothetical protein
MPARSGPNFQWRAAADYDGVAEITQMVAGADLDDRALFEHALDGAPIGLL